ncbi:MAG: hypothetical protein CME70_03560 [Halobacteriovorax sp.]|nr:hypothetical protein [Halobacteriovorax sp.]|tara:strand:- start:211014 stop:211841 length:828 start_codon:yes stop_codon:yes gene_type:complete
MDLSQKLITIFIVSLISLPTSALELKVMSYNIWGRPFPLPRKPARFKKKIPEALVKTKADIIGIQEAFTRSSKPLEKMGEYLHFAKFNKRGFLKTGAGLLTLSKFEIEKTKTMSFSKCAGTDCFAKKGVLFTRLNLGPGLRLDVYNTHLNAAGKDSIRELQIKETANFISKNSNLNPVILIGDMNTHPMQDNYREFKKLMSLKDSYANYISSLPTPTDHQINGFTNGHKDPRKGKRIDYIFYRGAIELLNSKVNMDGPKPLSDHYGVISTFRLSN